MTESELKEAFNKYFNEIEAYGFRSERCLNEIKYAVTSGNPMTIAKWMEAAFIAGAKLNDQ